VKSLLVVCSQLMWEKVEMVVQASGAAQWVGCKSGWLTVKVKCAGGGLHI